jgi:hypothetical protein
VADEIRIESLVPQPLPDGRRVTLALRVSGLPSYGLGPGMPPAGAPPRTPNVDLLDEAAPGDGEPDPPPDYRRPPTPYPDVTLSILDEGGNQLAAAYIVEHKEPEMDFTLHLPGTRTGARLVARAEMAHEDEVIQVVDAPFEVR